MDSLTKLFCDLISIPSPSGNEKGVADFIMNYLKTAGIDSTIDDTGQKNNSNTGNVIVKIAGDADLPTLLFTAHIDTVETGDVAVKPVISDGIVRSNGSTILGADNKASVAVLMETLIDLNKNKNQKPTVICAFVTSEERGTMGSSFLEFSEKIDYAFNVDGAMPIGGFNHKLLGVLPFTIKIYGKAAHAAIEPDKGINAIAAAALFITRIKMGRDEKGLVVNIGKISGGKADNVISDLVEMTGHVRAFVQSDIDEEIDGIELKLKEVARETGITYLFTKYTNIVPTLSIPENHKILEFAKKATEAAGLRYYVEEGYFSADANYLAKKMPVLNVARGGENPHSYDEHIAINDLHNLKRLIKEIIKAVA